MQRKILMFMRKGLDNSMQLQKIRKHKSKIKRNMSFYTKEINKWMNF